ncbi:MAG: DNA gyrase inhibitor YacG [Deltaproteobacteria bacterium]|nr:DNA gyrase inhibitor YacG [Deltaproteobacteria bacterium]
MLLCPICRKPTRWEDDPRGPFCSKRCKMVDLGGWLSGEYRIPGPAADIEASDDRDADEERDSDG